VTTPARSIETGAGDDASQVGVMLELLRAYASAALGAPPDLFAADLLGHSVEAAFPAAIAQAAFAIQAGRARQVLVTGTGPWRGEAVALLEAPA
jgi:3-oxoacyl-[acyl-carrier-protein] synthase II